LLVGQAGALEMIVEHEADEQRGLAFLPIGKGVGMGYAPGIFIGREYFDGATAWGTWGMSVSLRDQTGFQISVGGRGGES
jgi:hypothetical protein